MVNKLLKEYCDKINITITDVQLQKFQQYYDMLIEKNKVMNLTAITDSKDVVIKHFVDSIYLMKYMNLQNKNIMDVGTGAGFPGIPLAIMNLDCNFVLLDSLNKRINFLHEVCDACELDHVELVHSRAEDGARDERYREKFDMVVSRAVANMSTLLEYCTPYCKVGGVFVSYKTGHSDEEISNAATAEKILGCSQLENYDFVLPDTDIERRFAVYKKTRKVSKKYPRQAGKPKKEPL